MTICKNCDHFIEENYIEDNIVQKNNLAIHVKCSDGKICIFSRYIHMEDGGPYDFDHDAEPGETRIDWHTYRPDLFIMHNDGRVGPNSKYHNQRGKTLNDGK